MPQGGCEEFRTWSDGCAVVIGKAHSDHCDRCAVILEDVRSTSVSRSWERPSWNHFAWHSHKRSSRRSIVEPTPTFLGVLTAPASVIRTIPLTGEMITALQSGTDCVAYPCTCSRDRPGCSVRPASRSSSASRLGHSQRERSVGGRAAPPVWAAQAGFEDFWPWCRGGIGVGIATVGVRRRVDVTTTVEMYVLVDDRGLDVEVSDEEVVRVATDRSSGIGMRISTRPVPGTDQTTTPNAPVMAIRRRRRRAHLARRVSTARRGRARRADHR